MLRAREYADEAAEDELEAVLRLLRGKLGHRGLVADDQLQIGDEIDHQPPILVESLQEGFAPAGQLGVALAEERPYEALKRLRQGRIGNVTLVLIELARGE